VCGEACPAADACPCGGACPPHTTPGSRVRWPACRLAVRAAPQPYPTLRAVRVLPPLPRGPRRPARQPVALAAAAGRGHAARAAVCVAAQGPPGPAARALPPGAALQRVRRRQPPGAGDDPECAAHPGRLASRACVPPQASLETRCQPFTYLQSGGSCVLPVAGREDASRTAAAVAAQRRAGGRPRCQRRALQPAWSLQHSQRWAAGRPEAGAHCVGVTARSHAGDTLRGVLLCGDAVGCRGGAVRARRGPPLPGMPLCALHSA